jgi:hypothetical protein
MKNKQNIINSYWHYKKLNSYNFKDYELQNYTRHLKDIFKEYNIIEYDIIEYSIICKKNFINFYIMVLDKKTQKNYIFCQPILYNDLPLFRKWK